MLRHDTSKTEDSKSLNPVFSSSETTTYHRSTPKYAKKSLPFLIKLLIILLALSLVISIIFNVIQYRNKDSTLESAHPEQSKESSSKIDGHLFYYSHPDGYMVSGLVINNDLYFIDDNNNLTKETAVKYEIFDGELYVYFEEFDEYLKFVNTDYYVVDEVVGTNYNYIDRDNLYYETYWDESAGHFELP